MKKNYGNDFYEKQRYTSKASAERIVPIIMKLISPESVVDVGCGVGAWLSIFQKEGVENIIGIDGDYVKKNQLDIPIEKFLSYDLDDLKTLERKFDLVLCLEVAEHLNAVGAEKFVDFLISLGPIIVFSAAIPYQGGVNHVNEQWPSYWRDLFDKKGYVVIDCIRSQIWNIFEIEAHYAQNIFIYIDKSELDNYPHLLDAYNTSNFFPLSVVHPYIFSQKMKNLMPENVALKKYIKDFPSVIRGFIKRQFMK